jgi:hypothetical protein
MSFVERRRFLWVLFLAGIALAAVVANSTTLARMSFDELAQKSSAVARLRCQSLKAIGMEENSGRRPDLKLWSATKDCWERVSPCACWAAVRMVLLRG